VDWFTHETWKSVADFMSDWKTILTGLAAAGAAIGAFWQWGAVFARWIANFRRAKPVAPTIAAASPVRDKAQRIRHRRYQCTG
jgi:hypothetical protein